MGPGGQGLAAIMVLAMTGGPIGAVPPIRWTVGDVREGRGDLDHEGAAQVGYTKQQEYFWGESDGT